MAREWYHKCIRQKEQKIQEYYVSLCIYLMRNWILSKQNMLEHVIALIFEDSGPNLGLMQHIGLSYRDLDMYGTKERKRFSFEQLMYLHGSKKDKELPIGATSLTSWKNSAMQKSRDNMYRAQSSVDANFNELYAHRTKALQNKKLLKVSPTTRNRRCNQLCFNL